MSIIPSLPGASSVYSIGTTGLDAISNARKYGDSFVNKYILRPKTMVGIDGFLFDAATEDTAQMSADITDHYVENNMVINDHVAIKPIKITLKGYVGEVVYKKNVTGLLGLFNTLQTSLSVIPAYLGKYTPKCLQDIQGVLTKGTSFINKVDNYIARAKNIVNLFGSPSRANKQQTAYATLKSLFLNRILCSVETPFEYFDGNMVIEELSFRQAEDDSARTDIRVTLKEIRVARVTIISPVSKMTAIGRALYQRQSSMDNGKTRGEPVNIGERLPTGMRLGKVSILP